MIPGVFRMLLVVFLLGPAAMAPLASGRIVPIDLPGPGVGDVLEFEAVQTSAYDETPFIARYTFLPGRLVLDEGGVWHPVWPVEGRFYDLEGEELGWSSTFFDQTDGKPVMSETGAILSRKTSGFVVPMPDGTPIIGGSHSVGGSTSRTFFDRSASPCGMEPVFSARTLHSTETFCGEKFRRTDLQQERATFTWTGMQNETTVTFQAGFAHPVAFSKRTPDAMVRASLIGWAPGGQGQPPALELRDSVQIPRANVSHVTRFGPDASGFPSNFSLEDGFWYAGARSYEISNYTNENPDWYIAKATGWAQPDRGGWMRGWTFVLAGGETALEVNCGRRPPEGRHFALPLPLGGETLLAFDAFYEAREVPGVDVRPGPLPKPADVHAAWVAYQGSAGDLPAMWGFGPDPLTHGSWIVWAGNFTGVAPSVTSIADPVDPLQHEGGNSSTSAWIVDDTGQASGLYHAKQESMRSRAGLLAPPASTASDSPAGAHPPLLKEPAWALGVAAGLGGLGFGLWAAKNALAVLFSRVAPRRLLENDTRAKLVQLVESHPGIHFHSLLRKSGLANGSLVHHLRKLVQGNLLKAIKKGGFTCYFPPIGYEGRVMASVTAVKSSGARRILQCVLEQRAPSLAAVAAHANLDAATVRYHVTRLSNAGLVIRVRTGKAMRLSPTGLTVQALALASKGLGDSEGNSV